MDASEPDKSNIIDFIVNGWNPGINNERLLELFSGYFKTDCITLGLVDLTLLLDGSVEVNFYYHISPELSVGVKSELKKVEYSGAFKESFDNKKTIILEDYQKYSNAVEAWKKAGLKSLLSVPILKGENVYGVIQVGWLKERDLDIFVEDLKLFAKLMSVFLSESYESMKLELHKKTEGMHINISSSLKGGEDKPLKDWVIERLKEVLEFSGSEITGFIMPPNDIYCVVDRSGKFTVFYDSFNDKVKDWIAYKLYEAGIRKITTYKEAITALRIQPSREAMALNVKNGLFVPIEYGGEIVASFAYGFTENIENLGFHKIFLKNVGFHLVMAIFSYRKIKSLKDILSQSEEKFILSFMKMAELRDSYTHGHSERVAYYARVIGEGLGLPEREINELYTAGLLHDIGKIGIPDSILLKPGKLSKHEYEIIKYHSLFSYEMIKDIDHLKSIALCVRHHHERCDGSGYPDGILCGNIELCAKILAIADVFDALTSERIYREKKKFTPLEALSIMEDSKLDKEIFHKVKEDLVNAYLTGDMHEYNLPLMREIEEERVNIFFKDYLTGADRFVLFSSFVEDMIKKNTPFYLFGVDIVDLGYINYKYGVNYGNRVIEALAEELMKSPYLLKIMRAGADSFVYLCPKEDLESLYSFIEKVEDRLKFRFLNNDQDLKRYSGGFLYKTHVAFPDDGKTLEDLLYLLRARLKRLKFVNYKSYLEI